MTQCSKGLEPMLFVISYPPLDHLVRQFSHTMTMIVELLATVCDVSPTGPGQPGT